MRLLAVAALILAIGGAAQAQSAVEVTATPIPEFDFRTKVGGAFGRWSISAACN
ncbi:hypothetical protein [Chenggangzhangella methanolivorans]|uniref:Uncharacterized protein n=1 Tax=Chenggangzhangella methanolivorans TaxID=1437009 RepID=A0A9E6R6I8_9HYPH|nr:hypothetical protein [Chenggangzhangella methanolivorans]QZN98316.1 hypothetical protein K6K41_14390 [Chenggangzhangella methanolivorans]